VDLFRLPDAANPRMKWSYYARDGTFDQNNQPVYALFNTDHPERQNEIQQCIGNHLLLESSKETHLLHRQVTAQAHEIGDAIPAFPVSRLFSRWNEPKSMIRRTSARCKQETSSLHFR
jgi:hypothetical protein